MLEFWQLTPRETLQTIDAAIWREEISQRKLVWQVWHSAALQRMKRLPKMSNLLKLGARKVSPEEMRTKREDHKMLIEKHSGLLTQLGKKHGQ